MQTDLFILKIACSILIVSCVFFIVLWRNALEEYKVTFRAFQLFHHEVYKTAPDVLKKVIENMKQEIRDLAHPEQEPDHENKEYEADQLWAAQPKEYDP